MKTSLWQKIGIGALCLPFILTGLLFLSALLGMARLRVGWTLLTGWAQFLQRNWPQVTVNWTLIVTGILCSVALLVLLHCLAGWLYKQMQAGRGSEIPQPWRWGWSISIYCGIWLLFAIAFGASGVYRHGSWLLNYPDRWHEVREYPMADLKMAEAELTSIIYENNEELDLSRKAFMESTNLPSRKPIWEKYNVILYGDTAGKVGAFVMIPREWPAKNSPIQFAVYNMRENDLNYLSISNLPTCLEKLEKKYTRK